MASGPAIPWVKSRTRNPAQAPSTETTFLVIVDQPIDPQIGRLVNVSIRGDRLITHMHPPEIWPVSTMTSVACPALSWLCLWGGWRDVGRGLSVTQDCQTEAAV